MVNTRVQVRDYPLSAVHHGTALGNGYLGLLFWGEENILNITVGCASLWDHRGGMTWTARQNYRDIRAALEAEDMAAIRKIFAVDTEAIPGIPRRPSIIPVGRLVLTLPCGSQLIRNELHLQSGQLRVIYRQDSSEKELRFHLDPTDKGSFMGKISAAIKVKAVPAYHLSGTALSERSFALPQEFQTGCGGGFVQPMPADPSYGLAYQRAGDFLSGRFARELDSQALSGACTAPSESAWQELAQANQQYWRQFWEERPRLEVDNERLQELYEGGLFRFQSMTAADGVTAGLQGPWIEDYGLPPWNGDYHFNINIQMCYWPAYRSGLWDNLRPLFDMVWSWREKLQANARHFLGIEDGYMLPHAVDDRCTCMGAFWTGTIDHACTAWIAQMMYDYCDYRSDEKYLREVAFEFMRGTMRVFQEMLEYRPDGSLMLPVSVSPEYRGAELNAWGVNSSFQLGAIHRLALNLQQAAKILQTTPDPFWQEIREKLPEACLVKTDAKEEIGLWEGLVLEESHRHHSHLAGICPFGVINPADEKWRSIMNNTLTRWTTKGMGLWTGWCMPWAAMLYNRFNNGEMAELILEIWQRCFTNPGGGTLHDAFFPGFTYWSYRPEVMQMDAGMGVVTAIQDMFVHQRDDCLYLFAGIPKRWKKARIEDMPAPGGLRISGLCCRGKVQSICITATRDCRLKLALPCPVKRWHTADAPGLDLGLAGEIWEYSLSAGESVCLQSE